MWVRAHFEPPENLGTDRRRAPRRKLLFGAETGREGTRVIVRDLSSWGLQFEASAELTPGDRIEVLLPDGPVEAIVVWCDGNLCGGTFTQPISDAAIDAALLRSQLVSGDREEPEAAAERGAVRPAGIAAAYPRMLTTTAGAVLAMLVLLLLLAFGVLAYTPGLTP